MKLSENAEVIEHPLIEHKISVLRDKNTTVKEFRETVGEIASLLCYEACRDVAMDVVDIETPVAKTTGRRLKKKNISIVPILRAGIGMVDGILNLIPTAEIGHIGLYRNPETLKPVEYYCNLPSDIEEKSVLLVDPMLATGGSAVAAIDFLKEKGVKDIRFLCIIAAPEGMKKLCETHGDVKVYCAAYDQCLNDHGYIVPGLGDAGDRIFGTF